MDRDDVPVVGDDGAGRSGSPTTTGMALGLSLVVVAALVAVIGIGTSPGPPAEAPEATFPPIPTTSEVAVLEWQPAEGLGEVHHLADVVTIDDRHLAIGTSSDGVHTWASTDGVGWTQGLRWPGTDGRSEVTGVASDGARVVVTTAVYEPSAFRYESVLWSSHNGEDWESVALPSPDPDWIEARAEAVAIVDGTVVVRGEGRVRPHPDRLEVDLPPGLRRMLAHGELALTISGERVEARLVPGRVVYTAPLGELAPGVVPFAGRGPLSWEGGPGRMRPEVAPDITRLVTSAGDGSAVGTTSAGRVFVTHDGERWEPEDIDVDGAGHVPFQDGFAAVEDGSGAYAVDAEGVRRPLADIGPSDDAVDITDLAAGPAGIAAVSVTRGERTDPEIVVAGDTDTMLVLGGTSRVEVLDGGDAAFYGTTATAPIRVDPEGGGLQVVDPDSGSVLLDLTAERWIRALREGSFGANRLEGARLLHSSDGGEWASLSWEEISGTSLLVDPDVLVVGDAYLAVDQGVEGGPMVGAWVGTRRP